MGYIRITLYIRPFVQISCSRNSFTDEQIMMRLNLVAVYKLRMCMKEDNPGLNVFKGDN